MPIRTLENLYHGINAHLHSLAQNPLGSPTIWTSIRASHIAHITDALNAQLPPNYIARTEQSLQIWTEAYDTGIAYERRPRPDTTIFNSSPTMQGTTSTAPASGQPTRVVPIENLLDFEDITIPAVVVYRPESHRLMGDPVIRIELLSESNKRAGSERQGYLNNRLLALRSGTSLLELDYLHQTPSPLPGMPPYPDAPGSHPYSVAVTDRRPEQEKIMRVYEFNVDSLLPGDIALPLADKESITFDFNAVYQHTFQSGRWGIHIDYAEIPLNFDSYHEQDQERIRAVMARAQNKAKGEA